jgi:RimJ/RimL family protein N-acetyltransferase
MRLTLTRDVHEFAAHAQDFLAERLETNVLATILLNVLGGAHADPLRLFAYGTDDAGRTTFAALRTPPWFMVASPLGDVDPDELVGRWLEHDPGLPGINGTPAATRPIARAWTERTGGRAERRFAEAMHALDTVLDPPRPAPGALRLAGDCDRALLTNWTAAFAREAGLQGADEAQSLVERRLENDGMLVWEDGGPVSMVGITPAVSGVVRIGPVYTPPELRNRGYASSAVAATSRRALAAGAQRCMLFTDLANPTSNKIYAEVGYERCGDWEELAFVDADAQLRTEPGSAVAQPTTGI